MLIVILGFSPVRAADAPAREAVSEARTLAASIGKLLRQKDYAGAAKQLPELQRQLAELASGADDDAPLARSLESLQAQASRYAEQLRAAGIELPKQDAPAAGDAPQTAATAKGPSYARDVAPVFVESCYGCHGTGAAGGLSFANFDRFSQGGNSGAAIEPGKAEDSLLIQKLRGTAGARMPLRRDPLSDEVIGKIAAWIDAGAKFDGDSPATATDVLVRTTTAARMTDDELSTARAERAAANWKLALPGRDVHTQQGERSLVVGLADEGQLTKIAAAADRAQRDVAKLLRQPPSSPLVKGRLTVFAFTRRYDYGEFGRMVEKRELPDTWNGHARFNSIDAYVCVVASGDDEDSLLFELSRQVMTVYLLSRATLPGWFVLGSGDAVAMRVSPKSPAAVELQARIKQGAAELTDPKPLLTEKLADEQLEPLAAGLAGFLLSDVGRYRKLLDGVAAGQPFDDAVKAAYGSSPAELVPAWQAKAAKGRR
ncbi:MAG: hypothetical protein K1X74_04935 [Pirellulales bacterium]|nr:hypothetical protein [Pirellulales bacterium]